MRLTGFAKYAWGVLAYNLLVILWGALVRATGSGAGCGSHWPSCQGQVIPSMESIHTVIEFTHRVMTGVTLLLIAGMVIWALRAYPKGHLVRKGNLLVVIFIILESLVGAGLVLLGLVGQNQSVARAVYMAIHLVNTLLLLAALTLTAWWASGGSPLKLRGQGTLVTWLGIGLVGMLVLGATGAVTALGDTLFPAGSLSEGIQQDLSGSSHFLIQLRVIHPVIAVLLGLYLVLAAQIASAQRPENRMVRRLSRWMLALFFIQLGLGALNVILLAPIWMQLVHLLAADLVWITLALLTAAALAEEQKVEERLPLLEVSAG